MLPQQGNIKRMSIIARLRDPGVLEGEEIIERLRPCTLDSSSVGSRDVEQARTEPYGRF